MQISHNPLHHSQENPHSRFFLELLAQLVSISYTKNYENLKTSTHDFKTQLIRNAWSIEKVFEVKSLIVEYERYLDSSEIIGTPLENVFRYIISILSARYNKLLPKTSSSKEIDGTRETTIGKIYDLMDEDCKALRGEYQFKPGLRSQVENFRKKAFEHLPISYNLEFIQLSDYITHYCGVGVKIKDFDEKWVEDTLSFCSLIECQLLELHMKEVLRNSGDLIPPEWKTRLERLHDVFAWRKMDMRIR